MKSTPKQTPSRRKFLSLGLLGGAALLAPEANAQSPQADDGETIQMLTPDGKLVEVRKSAISQSAWRAKAKNADILKWTNSDKSSK